MTVEEKMSVVTLDDWFDETRRDLRQLAIERTNNEDVDCAIALLQAERSVLHAYDVMAQNGIDGDAPFDPAIKP